MTEKTMLHPVPRGDLRPHEVTGPTPEVHDAGLWFIGRIRTPWATRGDCPKRGDPENGPDCRIEIDPRWAPALHGLEGQERLQVLYWMHLSRRDILLQNPRFDDRPVGTFAIRSPVRPNPIASSVTRLLAIKGNILTVRGLDCVDGTPVVDLKPEFGVLP